MARAEAEHDATGRAGASGGTRLALYGYPQCPYCQRVLRTLDALELEVELRDTMRDSARARELYDATGRMTVPVLRIEGEDGTVAWMPESADIVDFLEERFGESR